MKKGRNEARWGAVVVGWAMLGACGGSVAREGYDPGPGETAGQTGAPDGKAGGATASGGSGPTTGGATASGGALPPSTAGAASGGRASVAGGGSPPGGASGAAGEPPSLPLPASCAERLGSETDSACSLSAFCDKQSQITTCGRLPSGRWQCACELTHRERTFEVEGASGLQACAVAIGSCSADESSLSPESCVLRNDDGSEDACRINIRCSREVAVPFAPQARAWMVRDGEAECFRGSGAAFECGCMYRGVYYAGDFVAASGTEACRPFVDACMDDAGAN